jgi:hypothetical protein
VDNAVELAIAALSDAPAQAWQEKAGPLEWDRWETLEHLADDLFAYAAQLGPKQPSLEREVPFLLARQREGGPGSVIFVDRAAGSASLLEVLQACGALLVAMVRTTGSEIRSRHVFGNSDPEGFAAMGIVEILVHTYDIANGLDVAWEPPADLCDRVLARLFPDAPTETDRWQTLLWATGRTELPGHPRLTSWRWYGAPR